ERPPGFGPPHDFRCDAHRRGRLGCSPSALGVRPNVRFLVSLQIRWKTSVPRKTPPPGPVATHRTTMAVGLTKRPNQTASMLQSVAHSLVVWSLTRRPRPPPAIS